MEYFLYHKDDMFYVYVISLYMYLILYLNKLMYLILYLNKLESNWPVILFVMLGQVWTNVSPMFLRSNLIWPIKCHSSTCSTVH